MTKKLIDTDVKLGENTLLEEAVISAFTQLNSLFIHRGNPGTNANEFLLPGIYPVVGATTNVPFNYGAIVVFPRYINQSEFNTQILFGMSTNRIWIRSRWEGSYSTWKELT